LRLEAASFKVSADSPQSLELVEYATHTGGSSPNQGGLALYFYDPDGFTLELFQPPRVG
jgi:hypothetical protein